jgi:transcriptional regulator with XRE-family HTH domain
MIPCTIPIRNIGVVNGVVKVEIGAILRAVRVRAGLSQEELAIRLNYNQSDISKFETGHKEPPASVFLRWFKETNAHEVAVAFLCGFDGITIMQQLLSIFGAS